MPLYEYQCVNDGTFELIQKFSDPPLAACPKCGGPIEKLLSAPAIQFKGTGWYITDYARKSSGGSDSGKDKGASSEKSEKSEKKDGGSGTSTTSTAPSGSASPGGSGSSGGSGGSGSGGSGSSSGSGDKK